MRILILNNDFRVYWKGRLIYLHNFFAQHGIDLYAVELFGKGSPYTFDEYNSKDKWWICIFPDNSADELKATDMEAALFARLDQINPDIVIGNSIVFYAGALGLRWAKMRKRNFIMFDDVKPSVIKRNFVVNWVKDTLISQADALWLPSAQYDAEYQKLKQKGRLIFYGLNSIDNDLFKYPKKKEFNHQNIVCVARLVPIKNFEGLLRAWQKVEEKETGYRLSIIGDGPEGEALKTLAASLHLTTIDFLGGVANDDLPADFYKADALVLASFSESWGLVVNEAMAAGLPILLSNRVNAGDTLLEEGANGFIFDPYSIGSIAAALLKYINLSVPFKLAMSEKSLSMISKMNYESMGLQLLNALTELQGRKPRTPGPLARLVIGRWNGKYNTAVWDKL